MNIFLLNIIRKMVHMIGFLRQLIEQNNEFHCLLKSVWDVDLFSIHARFFKRNINWGGGDECKINMNDFNPINI